MINHNNTCQEDSFRKRLKTEFQNYLDQQKGQYERKDCIKIDLHCHDKNSDVPDELWGRILSLPETWLETKKLVKLLKKNDCDLVTITNHNNAKSCWELRSKGEEVLVASEFTCFFPEYDLFVHVLAYGFDEKQEQEFNRIRSNIYDFCCYAHQQDIPLILPHPLYFYTRNGKIDMELFEKLAVLFQRFEVLNGQRDHWQSMLTLNWVEGLTADKISVYAKKHQLNPADFGVDPGKKKILTGGSDDHMGIFAGQSGSYLYVSNLEEKLLHHSKVELALDAIRDGRIIPYGGVSENQKLNIALLDYFAQVATNMQDPGLLRILFHRGDTSDKLACFAISNIMLEMQKRKKTRKFFELIHKALHGKKPARLIKWKIGKDYKVCLDYLEKIADSRNSGSQDDFVSTVNDSIMALFNHLISLVIVRTKKSLESFKLDQLKDSFPQGISKKFEIPSQISQLISGGKGRSDELTNINLASIIDNLSFPLLVSFILLGTTVGSTRLLYQNRRFLNDFAENINTSTHPKKALYLTDTLFDQNGVSNSLSGKLKHIQDNDLAIDYLICHESADEQPHLFVVRPLDVLSFPKFGEQKIRIPDVMQILRIFYDGGYDRVVCSTEGPMAFAALLIKHMFNVPAFFFMHTDWLEFIKETTDLNNHERDRFRRLLRFFYKQFEAVFVLNDDHKDWLTGHEMQLDEDKVKLTAHHIQSAPVVEVLNKKDLFEDANENTPIILFVGRLSKEKGVFDVAHIYDKVRASIPDLKVVFAGAGPELETLKSLLPDAKFLGWIHKNKLRQLYTCLDIKVFPSRFDTFGNVILEAFSYGMPVISYNCKGPKNIIQNEINGFLVETLDQMSERLIRYFNAPTEKREIRQNCLKRASEYQAEPIMSQFFEDLGLPYSASNKAAMRLINSFANEKDESLMVASRAKNYG